MHCVSGPGSPGVLVVFLGYWEEEHSYSSKSWENYQRQVLRELGGHGDKQDEDDDEDDDKCDSN